MQSLAESLFGVFFSSRDRYRSTGRRSSNNDSSSSDRTIINVEVEPEGLSDWDYDLNSGVQARHRALMRAAKEEGYRPIIERLNLLHAYNRYRSRRHARIFKEDLWWLSYKYEKAKKRGEVPRSR